MKVYRIPLLTDSTWCELCWEYHRYIKCPVCNAYIMEYSISVGHQVLCQCNTRYAAWESDDEVVLVKCEDMHVYKDKPLCFLISLYDENGCETEYDSDACCAESCPLKEDQ